MKRFGLVVGVGAYDDPEISDLPFAVADAQAVAACLRDACAFDEVVTLVSGGTPAPDHTAVLDALFRFAPVLTPDDLFFFYFAGHGVETGSGTFLLTRNARLRMPQVASLHSAVLSEALAQVACRDRVLVLDACRNDPRRGRGDGGNVMSVGFSRDILAVARAPADVEVTPATCVLFSCRAGERAYEWPDKGQGAFTHFLVEGLRGAARDEQGRLTVQGLGRFVEERVPAWARRTNKPPQTPWSEQTGSLRDIVLDAEHQHQRPAAPVQIQATPPAPTQPPEPTTPRRSVPRLSTDPEISSAPRYAPRSMRIPVGRILGTSLVVAIAAGAFLLGVRWHQTGIEHLQRSAEHLAAGSVDDAMADLAPSVVPPWLQPARGRLQREATDLSSAQSAQASGDVATAQALASTYPGDERFAEALRAARLRAAPGLADELVARAQQGDYAHVSEVTQWYADSGLMTEETHAAMQALRSYAGTAASQGDTAAAERIAAAFPDDTDLARIATEAREVAAAREQQFALAREAALLGDVDTTTRHASAYPGDPDFGELTTTAERVRDRNVAIDAAQAAAARGDVDAVRTILEQYPDALRDVLREAEAVAQRQVALAGLQRALTDLDYEAALTLARIVPNDDEEINELVDRVEHASVAAAEAAIAEWRPDDALRLLTGHTSDQASTMRGTARQQALIIEWEREFGPLPRDGRYLPVTRNTLTYLEVRQRFANQKIMTTGVITSVVRQRNNRFGLFNDPVSVGRTVTMVIDGSDGSFELRAEWRLDPSPLHTREAWALDASVFLGQIGGIERGVRCVVAGLFGTDPRSSPSLRWGIDPVEVFACTR